MQYRLICQYASGRFHIPCQPHNHFPLNKPSDQKALARILARFSILLLGTDVFTPTIIYQMWGQNKVVRKKMGRPRGDLALICRRLISFACIANNTYHLWLTTTFSSNTIISSETLHNRCPGVCDILLLVYCDDTAIYVRKPLPPGQDRVTILQHNLHQNLTTPISSNFNTIIASRYHDLLLSGDHFNDTTRMENHIFAAFGLYSSPDACNIQIGYIRR
jgi:hypothetical protein